MQSPGSLLKRLKESSFTVKLLCASADNDHVTDDQGHPRGGKKGRASCKNEDDGDNSKDLLNIHWFSFRGPFFSVGGGADEHTVKAMSCGSFTTGLVQWWKKYSHHFLK